MYGHTQTLPPLLMKGLVQEQHVIWYERTSDYSDGSCASCVHSIKNIRLQLWLSSCWLVLNQRPCTHILMTTPSQVHVHLVLTIMLLQQHCKLQSCKHPHSILQHQLLSVLGCGGRVWRLKTTLREPIWEFTRVSEIAEHILILTHE